MFDTGKVILFEDVKKANILAVWAFAQFVTVSAGIASYPLDTVRRRLMMTSGKTGADRMYNGTIDCFKRSMPTKVAELSSRDVSLTSLEEPEELSFWCSTT